MKPQHESNRRRFSLSMLALLFALAALFLAAYEYRDAQAERQREADENAAFIAAAKENDQRIEAALFAESKAIREANEAQWHYDEALATEKAALDDMEKTLRECNTLLDETPVTGKRKHLAPVIKYDPGRGLMDREDDYQRGVIQ